MLDFFYFINQSNTKMKKLIINEKNLPRVRSNDSPKLKQSDSSIRIRINKTQLSHETVPLKKSPSSELQDIQMCLQIFQKANGSPILIEEEKSGMVVQLLKNYRDTLTSNQQLMTQSLRFSKIKFKTLCESQEKQNITKEKTNKQIPQSDQSQQITQKTINAYKTPKNKRNLTYKKNTDQNQQVQEHNTNQNTHQTYFKQHYLNTSQNQYLKLGQYRNSSSMSSESQKQNQAHQIVTHKIQNLKQDLKSFTQQEINSLKKQINHKNQQIKELNDRIQQLNLNIQNLVKKNSLKAEEYNKLNQEYNEIKQNLSKIPILQEDLAQIKQKCTNLELINKELQKKKEEAEKNWRKMESEKNDKIEQEIGRYETAQKFYELTRRDLKEQNQNLISLLEERQKEITHLYQVIHHSQIQIQEQKDRKESL